MPVINRQKPSPPAQPPVRNGTGGGVLSRIRDLAEARGDCLKIALWGDPKVGKTRLACTFPKPLLIIGTEDGTASVVGTPGIQFVQLLTCAEMKELVEGPVASGTWKTVVLDNITKMRDMRISEILGLDHTVIQKGWGFARREDWIECANSLKGMLAPLLDMPRTTPINVVVIAQGQDYSKEGSGPTGSEIMKPMVGPAAGESVARFLCAECDHVVQCFVRPLVEEQIAMGPGGKAVKRNVTTEKPEYCLRVRKHPTYWTGIRQKLGAPELPECITDPTYAKLAALIGGK